MLIIVWAFTEYNLLADRVSCLNVDGCWLVKGGGCEGWLWLRQFLQQDYKKSLLHPLTPR